MTENQLTTIQEIFKPIPDFPGYEVSNWGRVRSFWKQIPRKLERGTYSIITESPQRVLKPGLRKGYLSVVLMKDHQRFNKTIHKLVLETFVGPCPPEQEEMHLNGIRTDCFLKNLEWGTRSKNMIDKFQHGYSHKGSDHPQAKLNEGDIVEIRKLYEQGCFSQREIGKMFSVHQTTILGIVRKFRWKHI